MPPSFPLRELGLFLIVVGLAVAAAGAALYVFGRLPGDIVVERGRWTLFVPITTMILLSIVLTLLLNLFLRR